MCDTQKEPAPPPLPLSKEKELGRGECPRNAQEVSQATETRRRPAPLSLRLNGSPPLAVLSPDLGREREWEEMGASISTGAEREQKR